MREPWEVTASHVEFMSRLRAMVSATQRPANVVALHPARDEAKARAAAAGGQALRVAKSTMAPPRPIVAAKAREAGAVPALQVVKATTASPLPRPFVRDYVEAAASVSGVPAHEICSRSYAPEVVGARRLVMLAAWHQQRAVSEIARVLRLSAEYVSKACKDLDREAPQAVLRQVAEITGRANRLAFDRAEAIRDGASRLGASKKTEATA